MNNTREKKKKVLFIWISRCENVQWNPLNTPTWFSQMFVLTQMVGGGGVKVSILAIFDVFSLPCTWL